MRRATAGRRNRAASRLTGSFADFTRMEQVRPARYVCDLNFSHCPAYMRSLIAMTAIATAVNLMTTGTAGGQATEKDFERARKVLASTPLIDGHNDLAWAIRESKTAPMDVAAYDLRQHTPGMTDLARLKQGMVGGQFWSIYVPGEVKDSGYARIQLEEFDIARRFIAMYPDQLQLALSSKDIRDAFKHKKIASLLGMEGGHAIENSLGALRSYYALGARYMTLTHNVTLD